MTLLFSPGLCRAAAFHHLKLYFAAISDCVRSIQLDPNYWRPFSRLGNAYMALGRFQEAAQFGFLRGRGERLVYRQKCHKMFVRARHSVRMIVKMRCER